MRGAVLMVLIFDLGLIDTSIIVSLSTYDSDAVCREVKVEGDWECK